MIDNFKLKLQITEEILMTNKLKNKIVHQSILTITKLIISVLLLNCLPVVPLSAQYLNKSELRVMTFNIRYAAADDGENSWEFRKNLVAQTIKNFEPDVFGLQEALQIQIDVIQKLLPNYDYVGVGRDDGKSAGEHSCIFYMKDRFNADMTETFWFSETPHVPGSKSWGNNITRICTWVKLSDKVTGNKFYMFNVHLDHESQPSRERSAELLVKKIKEKTLPVILTGDFNCGDDNPAIQTISSSGLIDSYRILHTRQEGEGTYHAFTGNKSGDKIDFIFVSKDFDVKLSEILRTEYNGKYPSDHFPVTAIIKFSK